MEQSFAVITGASSGIGFELAKQFGMNGYEVLIASDTDRIFEAQNDLEEMGINVDAIKVNLAGYAGVENLFGHIRKSGKKIDAIAVNAGVGVGGRFTETDLREEINLINLNVVSSVHVTKRALEFMKEQGEGKILFTSSIASEMPSPFEAVYGASKSFLSTFAESLRNELKDSKITITVLMPGATHTNFFNRAHMEDTRLGSEMKHDNDPEEAAKQGFEALMAGKEKVISESFLTKVQGYAMKILPHKAKAQIHRKMAEPHGHSH